MAEQREFERIPVSFEARYCNKDGPFNPFRRAELIDIHHQGCRLLGGANFKLGKPVSIDVELSSETSVHFEGVTAWCSSVYEGRVFETGIRFLTNDHQATS